MSEQDTFERLRKPTYSEMMDIWISSPQFLCRKSYREFQNEIDLVFTRRGWTVDEYESMAGPKK